MLRMSSSTIRIFVPASSGSWRGLAGESSTRVRARRRRRFFASAWIRLNTSASSS
jgi:hypothetical protein